MAMDEDQRLTCVNCGEEFLFTAGEQAFYRERGLTHAPTRCKRCRDQRKGQRSEGDAAAGSGPPGRTAGRETFAATCAGCGRETQVPFRPVAGRPVYCRDCFRDRKDAGRAGSSRPARVAGSALHARDDRTAARVADAADPVPGARQQGAVKWFNKSKGFGFIYDDGGEDIFVHVSGISGDDSKSLTQGERVGFDVVFGARGKQAVNVTRLG